MSDSAFVAVAILLFLLHHLIFFIPGLFCIFVFFFCSWLFSRFGHAVAWFGTGVIMSLQA
jgi:uncharacterized membrane protein YccC